MPDDEQNPVKGAERLGTAPKKKRRRSLRRAIQIDCNLESDTWDGAVALPATDISNEGLWVQTPLALERGEELVVSFSLPDQPLGERVWAVAEVARVGMWRRRQDAHPPGMGLVFTYCSERDRQRLSAALQGRPPRVPELARQMPPPLPSAHVATPPPDDPPLPAVLDWLLASE